MTDSTTGTPPSEIPEIPIEFVSEEEMAFIEAALAATRSSLSSSIISVASSSTRSSLFSGISTTQFQRNARSIESVGFHSKRRLSGCSETRKNVDIEDSGDLGGAQKKIKIPKSLLNRFRRKRGLSVTDLTASEWCEKQMEFVLIRGKPKRSTAMQAGSARHTKLEEETLEDMVTYFRNTCCLLPLAHDQLLLRYEYQGDHSLIGEEHFTYDSDWLKRQIHCSLEFWSGERDATYVTEEEQWKCRYCNFVSICPSTTITTTTTTTTATAAADDIASTSSPSKLEN